MPSILEVVNISKTYKEKNVCHKALKNISFSVSKGEILIIMGPSGSGKSTMLNIIGALDEPDEGSIIINGTYNEKFYKEPYATKYRGDNIGFIFQNFNLLKDLNVEDNLAMPLVFKGENEEQINHKVNDILEKLKIKNLNKNRVIDLSGGQMQKVAIGRALITSPKLILADEPTGNLDYNTSKEILKLLTKMNKELKQTMIIVTHDPVVASFGHRILFFKDGEIINTYSNNNESKNILEILNIFEESLGDKND